MSDIDHRLAVYGSLAPGRSNHDQMAGMEGTWTPGLVRGRLAVDGWGEGGAYPALVCDPDGPEVAVLLFESADLPAHWARLDAFEDDGYAREAVVVELEAGPVEAWIYARV